VGDTYRVLVGINYPPDDKRAEVGDIVSDLPDFATSKLLAAGVIEKASGAPVDAPAAPESNPAPEEPAQPEQAPAEQAPAEEAPAEPAAAPEEPAEAPAEPAPAPEAPAPAEEPQAVAE
jgi:hypothetical protein